MKLNTHENSVCPSNAWWIPVEHWENAQLKCSKISAFWNCNVWQQGQPFKNFCFRTPGMTVYGCVHNQKFDRSRFVRRDRCSPMKKNAFVTFITVVGTITSLYPIIPQSLCLAVWKWLLECLHYVRKSDFSQMHPSRSRFDYEHWAFCSNWSDQSHFWLQTLSM